MGLGNQVGSTTDHLSLLPTQHTERTKYNEGRTDRVVANSGCWCNFWYALSMLELGNYPDAHDRHCLFQWNGTTTYSFESQRDFGTDYGICCWYTPQFNFSEILEQSREMGLLEPDWGYWFTSIKKVGQATLRKDPLVPNIQFSDLHFAT